MGKFIKSYIVAAISTGVGALSAWLSVKFNMPVHISATVVTTPVLFGLALILKHWHLDALAMSLTEDDAAGPTDEKKAPTP